MAAIQDSSTVGPVELNVQAGTDVALAAVTLNGTNNPVLDVDVDTGANDVGATLTATAAISAGTVEVDGQNEDDDLDFQSTIASASGGVTINSAATVDLDGSVTGATTLTIQNVSTEVDVAQGVNLSANNGDLLANTGVMLIDLSGAAGTNQISSTGGSVNLANISDAGTPDELEIHADTDATLALVDIANLLDINLDDAGVSVLNANETIGAGTVEVTGDGTDDTFNFADTVTSTTAGVTVEQADVVDLDGTVTGATTLTISNVNTELDLAGSVNLMANNGSVDVNNSVALIDLSGAGGTSNVITATNGDVELAAVSDSGSPDELEINADDNVALDTVTIDNLLDVDVDEDNDGGTFTAGDLVSGQSTINSNSDLTITNLVRATQDGTGSVAISAEESGGSENLVITGIVEITGTGGTIDLEAGDNVTLQAGSRVGDNTGAQDDIITIRGDAASDDPGVGSTITIAGDVIASTAATPSATIQTNADDDPLDLDFSTSSGAEFDVDSGAGEDTTDLRATSNAIVMTDVDAGADNDTIRLASASREPDMTCRM